MPNIIPPQHTRTMTFNWITTDTTEEEIEIAQHGNKFYRALVTADISPVLRMEIAKRYNGPTSTTRLDGSKLWPNT